MPEHLQEVAKRLKELREIAGLSVVDVCKAISISEEEYLSYENADADIPVSVLYAAANIFGVSITEILTGDRAKLKAYSLVKKDKGLRIERSLNYSYKSLAYGYLDRKAEPLLVYVEPGADKKIVPNVHEGQEFHYCLKGTYEITIGKYKVVVEEGDSLLFDSKNPHAMRALGSERVEILVVVL